MSVFNPGSLETLDKANVQNLVNAISQKNGKLDLDEIHLEQMLLEFTEFFAKETPLYEEINFNGTKVRKPIEVPWQFELAQHRQFKSFTIPISRSFWAFPKVVSYMRQDDYRHEMPMPNLSQIPVPAIPDGTGGKGVLNSIKDIGKKLYRDPHSPYNANKDLMEYYSQIPQQWFNMLHIFELNVRNRPRINTRNQLDKIMNDLVIVFNALLEPNLVHVVHYANMILKTETEDRIVNLLTSYNQIQERHEKMMMMNPTQNL